MIDGLVLAFQEALAFDGLIWLVVAAVVGGLVRGFSGFGTAMIYMPVAGALMSPIWALTTVLVFDLFGPLPNVPRALRDGGPRQVMLLVLGAVISLPIGVWMLTRIDPITFRWMVSLVALILLVALLSGWRYRRRVTPALAIGIGAVGGFMSGVSGLAGPPVIMFYMSSKQAISAVRANILLFLLFIDVFAIAIFGYSDLLQLQPVLIGLILTIPYTIGNIVGAALFHPDKERIYRAVAYSIIGLSALRGLPVFG